MPAAKINPLSKSNPDTGFGVQASRIAGRFINKDGSFNLRKVGASVLQRVSLYSNLQELSWGRFFGVIVLAYILINILFTAVYLALGFNQLQGFLAHSYWGRVREVFYFSTQTFTTVGYGRINPIKDGADIVASLETMTGWMFFALVTGLIYGRFARPKAYIAFSEQAVIGPYRNGNGLMFRMVPYKSNHHLNDARVVVTLTFAATENGKQEYKFFRLGLERSRVDMFNMNWTVVHPIDQQSPLLRFTKEDMLGSELEIYIQVTGFDPVFANVVTKRSSYTGEEIVWGARFLPMYYESADGTTTILELNKLNDLEQAELVPSPA